MFSLFSKRRLAVLSALVLGSITGSLSAWDCCYEAPPSCNRMYVGAFGGGIYSDRTKGYQLGTALFTEAEGGPLAVDARGHFKSKDTGFGGVQIGYEWSNAFNSCCSNWSLAPAAEIEGFWFSHKRKGHFNNALDLDRLPEHDFVNSFRMNAGVYLANAVVSLNNCWRLSPYVGVGVGATRISLHNAKSIQVAPPEVGINHFNSRRSDSAWAFAAQAKAGLRYTICNSLHIFGEYRYLFVDSSNYIFGSTAYPTHAHTTPWNVKLKNIHYNAFAVGIQYDL